MAGDNLEVPKESAKDRAITVLRMAIAGAPYVGGAAVEMFNALVVPPLEKRKAAWMEAVATELQRLAQRESLSLESLLDNDQFTDAMLEASQAALRTSNATKLKALKCAVINSALPEPPEDSVQKICIRLVDELTEWHIKILVLFHEPRVWFLQNGISPPVFNITSSLSALLEKAFPELRGRRDLYDYLANDLFLKGLLGIGNLHMNMSADGAYDSRSTKLGKTFIGFISEKSE